LAIAPVIAPVIARARAIGQVPIVAIAEHSGSRQGSAKGGGDRAKAPTRRQRRARWR